MTLHPTVSWAQRAEFIYLTVNVSDITDPKITLTADRFQFKGKGEKEQNEYECEIEFLKPVDVEKSKQVLTARNLSMVIYKTKDSEGYWDKLQKGSRLNFLKVDFAKWRDEDDDDEDTQADPMAGLGGPPGAMGGAGGMPDMASMASMMGGGAGGMDFSQLLNSPDFNSLPEGDSSSDEDEEEEEEEQKDVVAEEKK